MTDVEDDNLAGRFRGCAFGAAIADALAFPHLHYSKEFLRSTSTPLTAEFGEHHTSAYPTGQYSDDTQILLVLLKALVTAAKENTELDAAFLLRHLLPLWRDQVLVERDASSAEAMERVLASGQISQPRPLEAGRAEASPVGRAVAAALWFHKRPEQMYQHVEALVRLTHTDRRTVACAAAVAAMIEYALTTTDLILGELLDRVAAGSARFDERLAGVILDFPRVLSMTENRCQRHFEEVYEDRRYPMSEEGLSVYSVPTMLFALYSFLKSPHKYEGAVDRCLRLGGHMDTAAFLAGAVSGAYLGESAIPDRLKTQLHGGAELSHAVDELHELWTARQQAESSEKR